VIAAVTVTTNINNYNNCNCHRDRQKKEEKISGHVDGHVMHTVQHMDTEW